MNKQAFKFFAFSLFIIAVILPLSTGCKKKKVFTVGIVNINPGLEKVVDGFKSGMAKYGYAEGENVVYRYKGVVREEAVDAILWEMIEKKVDLILSVTLPVSLKAKKATEGTQIPVVFAPVLYAVESGLVKSRTNHGCNLTGIQIGDSTEKALELHKTIVPGTKNILVPCKCNDESSEMSLSDLKRASEKLGINLVIRKVENSDELKETLSKVPAGVDSLWLLNSSFLVSHINMFVEASRKYKLPLSSGTSQYKAGVMISYGQAPFHTGEQASRLAHKIFEGVRPEDIPVESTEFYLGINLKTAQDIGLRIPDDILQHADGIVR